MGLGAFVASKRRQIYEELKQGLPPSEGEYSEALLRDAKSKGAPQMGSVVYRPLELSFEYIFSAQDGSSTVFAVRIVPPERIVFLPVPSWVVESIWQGEIDGTYCFESEAAGHVQAFQGELEPGKNDRWFEPRPKIGRS